MNIFGLYGLGHRQLRGSKGQKRKLHVLVEVSDYVHMRHHRSNRLTVRDDGYTTFEARL